MKNRLITIVVFGIALMGNQLSHANCCEDFGCCDPCKGIFYIAGSGAIVWHNDLKSQDGIIREEFEYRTGWGSSASVGLIYKRWGDWDFRFEAEYVYRKNKLREFVLSIPDVELVIPISGRNEDSAAMANFIVDVGISCGFYLYYGAGIGVSWNKIEVNFGDDLNEVNKDTLFAWQILAGLSYCLSQHLQLTAGYRLFATARQDRFKNFDFAPKHFPITNSVDIGLRISL